jgi:hypothetical protein
MVINCGESFVSEFSNFEFENIIIEMKCSVLQIISQRVTGLTQLVYDILRK